MPTRWGLGPVFAFEWLSSSRRPQMYAARSLLVLLLGIGLTIVWQSKVDSDQLTIRAAAKVGEYFFYTLVGMELALVMLAAPAATAGAICQEKARGTLLHLLVTDLSNAEIILGKLTARLLPILGLILYSAPVLFFSVLLGGIDPEGLFGALLVILGIGIASCTLALVMSIWSRKTYEALLVTYLFCGVPMLIGPIWNSISYYVPLGALPLWAYQFNPFSMAFLPYLQPGSLVLERQLEFLGTCLGLSLVLALIGIATVRRVTLRQAGQPDQIKKRWSWLSRRWFAWVPGPSLDQNPVAWREWHRRRPSAWVRFVWFIYGSLAVTFTIMSIGELPWRGGTIQPWTNALQVSIGLLLLSVSAVTTLNEERVRGSLDVLLATPLPTAKIVWGKWWGTYRGVLLLAVLPTILAAAIALRSLFAPQSFEHFGETCYAVQMIAGMVLAYGAAVTSLGLALAVWVQRPGRALGICVGIYVTVTVGTFMLPVLLMQNHSEGGLASASPFYGPGALTDALTESRRGLWRLLQDDTVWIFVYSGVALALYLATLRTFDRCLGRMTARPWREPQRPIRKAHEPEPVSL